MARRLLVLVTALGLVLAFAATALGATVTVRVEGKTQSIFGSVPVKVDASNPLVALDVASALGEFYAHVTQSSFGQYVSQIGRYPGSGSSGWVFKVNGASPPVGADQVTLKDGDEVLWYYATFSTTGGPKTLSLKATAANCYAVTSSDDAGKTSAVAGAQVDVDGRRFKAGRQRSCLCRQPHRDGSRVCRRGRAVERREVSLKRLTPAPPRRTRGRGLRRGGADRRRRHRSPLGDARPRQRRARRRDRAGGADPASGAAVEGEADNAIRRRLRAVDRRHRGKRAAP